MDKFFQVYFKWKKFVYVLSKQGDRLICIQIRPLLGDTQIVSEWKMFNVKFCPVIKVRRYTFISQQKWILKAYNNACHNENIEAYL